MVSASVTGKEQGALAPGWLRWGRRLIHGYWLPRLFKAFLTVYIVITLTFFLVHLLPGNPIQVYINNLISQYSMTYQQAQSEASSLYSVDLSKPVLVQYGEYLGHLVHGDLGTSITAQGTPVTSIIRQYLPWTLFSVGIGLAVSVTIGILLGVLMAYKRESWFDHVLSTLASLLSSIPNYLVGIMVLIIFGVRLGWFDIAGMRGSYSPDVHPQLSFHFITDALYHAELPILVYVITTVGAWMLLMKSSTLSVLEEDYVTVARARGLHGARVMIAYVGRNAVLPVFTQLAISVGFIVGGSVLIETIFSYQGIGYLLTNSVNTRDYPVMQGVFMVITISVVVANLLADFLYVKLDPRIGAQAGARQ